MLAPRVPLMLGSATLTMLESSTAITVPLMTLSVTSHLLTERAVMRRTVLPQAAGGGGPWTREPRDAPGPRAPGYVPPPWPSPPPGRAAAPRYRAPSGRAGCA